MNLNLSFPSPKIIILYICRFFLGPNIYLKLLYIIRFKRIPRYRTPTSFNEYLLSRKLLSPNPKLCSLGSKSYSKSIVSQYDKDLVLPRLSYLCTLEDIFKFIPSTHVIVKSDNASGLVLALPPTKPSFLSKLSLISLLLSTRAYNLYLLYGEYSYKNVQPALIVEPLIRKDGDKNINSTNFFDIKVFVYKGQSRILQFDFDRHSNHSRMFLTPDGLHLPFKLSYPLSNKNISPMLVQRVSELAVSICPDIEFCRVDFLFDTTTEMILFVEYTLFPGGGLEAFDSYHTDQNFFSILTSHR